ncbi:hypothetical protein, partial [Parabacteroides goldsteinii]|uniref:hypothetical protein n=1 Tax=Parabacteroides goldsteinii TaxID=328812 RepID=UPI0025A0EEDF
PQSSHPLNTSPLFLDIFLLISITSHSNFPKVFYTVGESPHHNGEKSPLQWAYFPTLMELLFHPHKL